MSFFNGKTDTSEKIETIPEKMYSIGAEYIGIKGKPYCAYFGVVFLENDKEIDRKIQWLNDFSGQRKKVNIVFNATSNSIRLIYRINDETPFKSECEFSVIPLDSLNLKETDESLEHFDMVNNYPIPRPKELTNEEETSLEKNLVWVFGSPRSGTTWVSTELLSHNTFSINEPHLEDHLGVRVEGIVDHIITWPHMAKKNPNYFFSDAHKETWKYFLRKLILNRIYSEVRDLTKKIIIKSPGSFGAFDMISECLPSSKIIILLRDGRDVIDSFLDAIGEDGFMTIENSPLVSKDSRLDFTEYRAKMWVSLIENLMMTHDNHQKDYRLLVRYENLLKNTVPQVEKIYKFLGINIKTEEVEKIVQKYRFEELPTNLKGKGKFHRSAIPGGWKKNLSTEEKNILQEIMGKTLQKIGY